MIIEILNFFDEALWTYIGMPIIMALGLYLSFKSGFVQIRRFPSVVKTFLGFLLAPKDGDARGVQPLQAFFACVGGCVGIGNIVSICTAVQVGGPGALFWIWVTATLGMLVKYSEIYLGMKYRVKSEDEGYAGGPQYFLKKVFKTPFVPMLSAVLLCIYGVEVYQFSVITHSVSYNFGVNHFVATFTLLVMVLFAGWGGVKRVGNISAVIIPVFVTLYVGMGLYALCLNYDQLGVMLGEVFRLAFTPAGAFGGFVGSTLMVTISQGVKRGCYTGDVGVGYASVIHSESSVIRPEKQASLAIFDMFLDTFIICTTSITLILSTGVWSQPMDASLLVQTALAEYFPYMNFFMPFFLFLLGYSTINAYFVVGLKCARYISPRFGTTIFNLYAIISLTLFSFVDSTHAQSLMAIAGGLLLVINCYGIYKLRAELSFDIQEDSVVASCAQCCK
ncbi:MAG: sodium:alanine symporter family protein [Chlamydiia bacterium]|nr:sodium:alanine symporter family protein [Chlamydiia bacterium]